MRIQGRSVEMKKTFIAIFGFIAVYSAGLLTYHLTLREPEEIVQLPRERSQVQPPEKSNIRDSADDERTSEIYNLKSKIFELEDEISLLRKRTEKQNSAAPSQNENDESTEAPSHSEDVFYEGKTVSQWAQLLYDEDSVVRQKSLKVLSDLGPLAASAVPDLIHILRQEEEDYLRQLAGRALRNIGKSAVPSLIDCLKISNERDVHWRIYHIFGKLGEKAEEAVPILIEHFKKPKINKGNVARALRSIGIKNKDYIEYLLALLRTEDWELRLDVAVALAGSELHEEHLPFLEEMAIQAREELKRIVIPDNADLAAMRMDSLISSFLSIVENLIKRIKIERLKNK